MNKIYDDAKDKNVAVRILYGKSSGEFLYYDEKTTQKVSKEDAFDAFLKGMLVLMNGEYHKIIHCKLSDSGYVMIAHNGTSAVTFKTDGVSAMAAKTEPTQKAAVNAGKDSVEESLK